MIRDTAVNSASAQPASMAAANASAVAARMGRSSDAWRARSRARAASFAAMYSRPLPESPPFAAVRAYSSKYFEQPRPRASTTTSMNDITSSPSRRQSASTSPHAAAWLIPRPFCNALTVHAVPSPPTWRWHRPIASSAGAMTATSAALPETAKKTWPSRACCGEPKIGASRWWAPFAASSARMDPATDGSIVERVPT